MNNVKSHESRLAMWKKSMLEEDLAKKSRIREIKRHIKTLRKEKKKLKKSRLVSKVNIGKGEVDGVSPIKAPSKSPAKSLPLTKKSCTKCDANDVSDNHIRNCGRYR